MKGFYERFAAKGQIERVARIHRELARAAGKFRLARLSEKPLKKLVAAYVTRRNFLQQQKLAPSDLGGYPDLQASLRLKKSSFF